MRIPLGELVECLDRLRVPVKESERKPGPVPYYGANGQQGWIDRAIFNESLVVVAEDGGHFTSPSRGVAYRISGPSWVNNHGHVLRATDRVDAEYLYHSLRNFDFGPYISGSTRSKLTQKQLLQAEILLPPLDEQRRIASILDQADELRAMRRCTLTLHDDLTQSIFLDMFGCVAVRKTVDQIAKPVKGSIRTGPFGSQLLTSEFVDEGIAVLGLDNVVGNEFRWAERRYISEAKYEQLARYTVHSGDVLISIMGTTGRCVVVPDDIPTAINTKHICAITPDVKAVLPLFLRACFLWHPDSVRYLRRQTKGAIMDGLNMGIVKKMPLPVPSLNTQQKFVRRVEAAHAVRRTAETDQLDELFASLQSRAFSGRL